MIQKFLFKRMNLATDAKGATYAEYAILVAVIALVVITAAALFGETLLALYESFSL